MSTKNITMAKRHKVTSRRIEIPNELHAQLKTIAATENKFMHELATEAIQRYLNNLNKQPIQGG